MGGREIKGTDRADHISPDDSDNSPSFLFSLTSRREDQKNIFYGAPEVASLSCLRSSLLLGKLMKTSIPTLIPHHSSI